MPPDNRLAFTVAWEVRPGEIDKAKAIVTAFLTEARREPGLETVEVLQRADNPAEFLFYEVFQDRAAFAAHQQTPHFRSLILEQAVPLLARRERREYRLL